MIIPACAPVLLTVFNRPEETARMVASLREVKPSKIFISADGPRNDHSKDMELCARVRSIVLEGIDWHAEMITDFAPSNLGLRHRMASAITWALSKVDRIIVLEDDCIPSVSFFRFCTELLEYYSEDNRIGSITGDNFQGSGFSCDGDYYFSRYPHIWGWATWRRAWNYYDVGMSDWSSVRDTCWLQDLFSDKFEMLYWRNIFDDTLSGKINTWDYQWVYACWRKNMLTVTPKVNLVSNIGIGASATNTCTPESGKHNLNASTIENPIRHPNLVVRKKEADNFIQKTVFGRAKDKSLIGRIKRLAGKIKNK